MAKRTVQQEDPWSGFVDVLSNVVMVVTFIVIILGIAMMALATQVAETIAKDLLQAEREKIENAVDSSTHACVASDGEYRVVTERPTLVADEVEGQIDLTIRRREDRPTEATVAAMETQEDPEGAILLDSTGAVMVLQFEPEKYALPDDLVDVAQEALDAANWSPGEKLEVRGISASRIGSISEARRVSFYRAMAVRNLLIGLGVPRTDMRVRVRESVAPEETDKVFVFRDN